LKTKNQTSKGFTLVELIIVIAIIAILAAAIFVAIDPARRLHEARNARRQTDVNAILEALKQYQVDHSGNFPYWVNLANDDEYRMIGLPALSCDVSCTAKTISNYECLDLSDIGSNYLSVVPHDPKTGTDQVTGYYFMKDSNGALAIGACEPEGEGPGGTGTAPIIEANR